MKKTVKIIGILFLVLLGICAFLYWNSDENLPTGQSGPAADALAKKMLTALNHQAYDSTRYVEWSFRGKHFYKWDKHNNTVDVSWNGNRVSLNTLTPTKSNILANSTTKSDQELIDYAEKIFNNDSFWLVAPYKVFEPGIERRLVTYEGQEALLVTYTTGGSTPGDSYLWLLDATGKPYAYKMWVSIIPVGGMTATWDSWITTQSGAILPTEHKLPVGTLDMGSVKAYN
ncbi:conserved hypothetical protein [Tenacibaculum litopenaei]|uniref:hypothetical protein n=1 Tax=Tenacibaculum litopenaei TaxID=396016 RepID=UPI0038947DB5